MKGSLLRNIKGGLFLIGAFIRINRLKIQKSGMVEGENIAFVMLDDTSKFYAYPSQKWQKIIYLLTPFKRNLTFNAFNVAFDITRRFWGPIFGPLVFGTYYTFNEDDVVFEIGAFTGYYAMRVSKILSQKGKVIAVEAIPENFKILEMNIQENKLSNVILLNKGLYSKEDKLIFYRASRQKASFIKENINLKEQIEIDVTSLDNIVKELKLQKVHFVRIQINGGEIDALRGAEMILSKFRPVFLIAAPYSTRNDVIAILKMHNYQTTNAWGSVIARPK